MGITQKEADALESEFQDAMPDEGDYSEDSARKLITAWNHLVQIMARENNMSDSLGIESID